MTYRQNLDYNKNRKKLVSLNLCIMKRSLDSQIALTKYHSLHEFSSQIAEGKLKAKAQMELLSLRDTVKFERYIKKYQLDEEVERKLIAGHRKDLLCIYFSYHKCRQSIEVFLVHYPVALNIYAKHHTLCETAQMEMVRQKKLDTAMKYIKKHELCKKAEAFFRSHASKELVIFYDRTYGC